MTDVDTRYQLPTAQVRHGFERASAEYDAVAVLQREVVDRLLQRLDYVRLQPQRVLDLGAGTGYALPALRQRYPRAELIALDLAQPMLSLACQRVPAKKHVLARVSRHAVCADAQRLPLASNSVDLVFSSLMLQWCNDLDAVFTEVRRILRPDGLFQFATLGPDTLKELRQAWASVNDAVHVHRFIDMHDVGDALLRSGLAEPVLDVETLTLTYRQVNELLRDLRQLGASNRSAGRAQGLTTPQQLNAMQQNYVDGFAQADGLLPSSWEVVYGHAWRGRKAPPPAKPGQRIDVPIDVFLKQAGAGKSAK
jgi:malonyl-CoA O-methyltransferase